MKTISLTQSRVALVDDADYERLNQHRWQAHACPQKSGLVVWYARRSIKGTDGIKRHVLMHQEIVSAPMVDHRDGDGLNNQRSNLRPCSTSQNQQNSRKRASCRSRFKGVSKQWDERLWFAQIRFHGRLSRLGYFESEELAARAYDAAAILYFGEFAKTNQALGLYLQ